MREPHRSLLEFAVEVAWRAGRATLTHFQTGIAAEVKPDNSPVTIADRAAEQIARDLIESRFPQDAILGEEFGETRAGATRRWILDPIDGTRSYLHGVPFYGVLLAVEDDGDPVLGVIHFPALSETVYAALGEGCWWDGRRALVSDTTRVEHALVLTTSYEGIERDGYGPAWERVRSRAALARTWGDCYGHALVATGRAEAMFDARMSIWDAAALKPVIEEAGGVFTDWSGVATHVGGSAISSNAALAREIRTLLNEQE
jgi:histidinol phosphatase-like enzyme (inositol monophosphatase family)